MEKKLHFKFHPTQHYIEGSYKGLITVNIAVKIVKYIIEQMQAHDCLRVFFDASQTLSSATTAENFEFAQNLSETLEALGDFRWAVFYQNDPFMYEMIYKMLAQAGIASVYMSTNKEEALHWLLEY